MSTIKEAADRLLKSGKITEQEYKTLEPSFTKEAFNLGRFLKSIEGPARGALYGTALAGLSASLVKENLIDPILKAQQLNNSYNQLAEKTPQLAEKDQDQVREYFDVIKSFSPKSAANPLVAGALVNKMMEFGGVDHRLVHDLVSIESGAAQPSLTQNLLDSAAKSVADVNLGTFKVTDTTGEKENTHKEETTVPTF